MVVGDVSAHIGEVGNVLVLLCVLRVLMFQLLLRTYAVRPFQLQRLQCCQHGEFLQQDSEVPGTISACCLAVRIRRHCRPGNKLPPPFATQRMLIKKLRTSGETSVIQREKSVLKIQRNGRRLMCVRYPGRPPGRHIQTYVTVQAQI